MKLVLNVFEFNLQIFKYLANNENNENLVGFLNFPHLPSFYGNANSTCSKDLAVVLVVFLL